MPAVSLVEHGDGLARPRGGGEVDAEMACSPGAGVSDRGLNVSDRRRLRRLHLVARVPDGKPPLARRDDPLDAAPCFRSQPGDGRAAEEQQVELAGAVGEHAAVGEAAADAGGLRRDDGARHPDPVPTTNVADRSGAGERAGAHRRPARASLSCSTLMWAEPRKPNCAGTMCSATRRRTAVADRPLALATALT